MIKRISRLSLRCTPLIYNLRLYLRFQALLETCFARAGYVKQYKLLVSHKKVVRLYNK